MTENDLPQHVSDASLNVKALAFELVLRHRTKNPDSMLTEQNLGHFLRIAAIKEGIRGDPARYYRALASDGDMTEDATRDEAFTWAADHLDMMETLGGEEGRDYWVQINSYRPEIAASIRNADPEE